MKKQQQEEENLNQDKNYEKLNEDFSSKPFVKKRRGRPKKNILTKFKNIPSQTKRKRGRLRKQMYEDELLEILVYAQKGSQTKLE